MSQNVNISQLLTEVNSKLRVNCHNDYKINIMLDILFFLISLDETPWQL